MGVLGESSLSGGEEGEHEGHDWVIPSRSTETSMETEMPTESIPDEITEEPAKRSTSLDFSRDLGIPLVPVPWSVADDVTESSSSASTRRNPPRARQVPAHFAK